jgi:hypothetical protein
MGNDAMNALRIGSKRKTHESGCDCRHVGRQSFSHFAGIVFGSYQRWGFGVLVGQSPQLLDIDGPPASGLGDADSILVMKSSYPAPFSITSWAEATSPATPGLTS